MLYLFAIPVGINPAQIMGPYSAVGRYIALFLIILDLRGATGHNRTSIPLKPVFLAVDKVTKARCVQLRHLSSGILWPDPLWTAEVNCLWSLTQ